jgi:hypothetical protein
MISQQADARGGRENAQLFDKLGESGRRCVEPSGRVRELLEQFPDTGAPAALAHGRDRPFLSQVIAIYGGASPMRPWQRGRRSPSREARG